MAVSTGETSTVHELTVSNITANSGNSTFFIFVAVQKLTFHINFCFLNHIDALTQVGNLIDTLLTVYGAYLAAHHIVYGDGARLREGDVYDISRPSLL